jgi:hypothetical protein
MADLLPRVPKRKYHKHIERMGIDAWFTGPPHLWADRTTRGDSVGLFNRLVLSLDDSQLEEKRNQLAESYSHFMTSVEENLQLEYMYDRMIEKSTVTKQDVHYRWKQKKAEKSRKYALAEMDRIGPVVTMLTQHILAVRAGNANPTEDGVSAHL